MRIISKSIYSLTIERFLLLCLLLAIASTFFSMFAGYLVADPVILVPISASVLLSLYFLVLLLNARKKIYRSLLEDEIHNKYEWAARLYPDIEKVIPRRDHIVWTTTKGEMMGAKILAVIDVPYTAFELDRADLERRLRAYSIALTSTDEFMIATYQMKLPVDKEAYLELLRRERDRYKLSYEVGGPKSHLDQSERFERTLKRIEERLKEEPSDTRFFIIVMLRGSSLDDIKRKFEDIMPSIKTRFESDVGVKVKELTHEDLIDAFRFFPPAAPLETMNPFHRIRPVRVLSMDLVWQNPLVARRMPPLEKLLKGALIGFTPDKVPVTWNPYVVPNPHAVILGPTRSGKTTLLKSFIARALDLYEIPVWVFDPSDEYVEYIRSRGGIIVDFKDVNSKVNPLVLYGVDPETRISKFLEMLTYLSGLTGPERAILREEILEAYEDAEVDLIDKETWTNENSSKVTLKGVYENLVRKYEGGEVKPEDRTLVRSIIREKIPAYAKGAYGFTSEGNVDIEKLVKSGKSVCFSLKGVPDKFGVSLVWTIMDLLGDYMGSHALSDRIRLIVAIDEAHRFCNVREGDMPGSIIYPPPIKFVKEAGKYGFCEICATQDVSDLPDVFFNNAGTLIVFGSSDEATLEFYRKRLGLLREDIERMKWFSIGDCFVRFYSDPRPIQVHVVPEYSV